MFTLVLRILHTLNLLESGDVFILHYCVIKVPKSSSIFFQILAPALQKPVLLFILPF